MTVPYTFATASGSLPLSQLDSNFTALGQASNIANTPAGTIVATTVQGAINEIVSDLAASSGSSLVGYLSSGTGAVASTVQTKLRESVSVKDFGAKGDGTTDDTAAIQAAINYASNSNVKGMVFPAGTFKYTKLYCVYDASNNPGFNVSRNGQILLIGNGGQPQSNQVAGTILSSTATTGDCFIASNYANDVTPWASQEFEARDITFSANTTGFVVVAAGVVTPRFNNCKIYQSHINGSGLYVSTSFLGTLEKLQIRNSASGTKTGTAIKFTSALVGGLLTLRDINVSGFAYGFQKDTGQWQNISIYDSEITGSTYAIYMSAGTLDLLNIQGCYFEGACTSFISATSAQRLRNLNIAGSWFYSNNVTGTAIDLNDPFAVSISNCYASNQYTTFLAISTTVSGYNGGGHAVSGMAFNYSVNPVSVVTYFTGVLPALLGVDYPASNANCKLVGSSSRPITFKNSYLSANYFSASHVFETQTTNFGAVAGGTIDLGGIFPIPSFTTTYNITSPSTHSLPPISFNLPHGYAVTITNEVASTQTFPVKTAVADGAATIGNVAPGGQRRFVFFNDGVTTGWK